MRLYEITQGIQILEQILESDEDFTPEMKEELDKLQQDFPEKIQNCAAAVKNLRASRKTFKEERDRLNDYIKSRNRQIEWLENYIMAEMQRVGKKQVDTGIFNVKVQRNSQPRVIVLNTDDVPPIFKEKLEEWHVHRDTIKNYAMETGEIPAGVRLETGNHLRVNYTKKGKEEEADKK